MLSVFVLIVYLCHICEFAYLCIFAGFSITPVLRLHINEIYYYYYHQQQQQQ
jgi:CRISPR-associated protein Cas8b1/Cst1 subtype I-B